MKYNSELIGKIILSEREKRQWSQKKLGEKLGVSGKQISNYEHGDPIPPIDIMLNLCDIFDCELGFLLGEESYSEGTKLQTAIRDNLKLTTLSTAAIHKITGNNRSSLSFGYESENYTRILNNYLSSPFFLDFMEALLTLDERISKQKSIFDSIIKKYGKPLFEEAFELYVSKIDYVHDFVDASLPENVIKVLNEIESSIDKSYDLSFEIKVSRFELNEIFEKLITNLYPLDKHN